MATRKRWEDYDTIICLDGTIIDMNKLVKDQATAKAALIHLSPVFSNFINILHPVYTFHFDTQATDGYHLFINPQFTSKLTMEEKVFVMAHECMHCVLDHMRRGEQAGHDPFKSNVAADYEVNQTLVDLGLFKAGTIQKLRALIDSKYSGWAYERIYDDNPSGPQQKQNQKQKQNQGQDPNQSQNQNQNQSQNQGQSQGQNQGSDGDNQDQNPGQNQSQNQGQSQGQGQNQNQNQGQSNGQNQGSNGGNQGTVTAEDCTPAGNGQDGSDMEGGFTDVNTGNDVAKKEGHETASDRNGLSKIWKEAAVKAAKHTQPGTAAGDFMSKIIGLWQTNTDWKKTFKKIVGRSLNTQDKRQAYANKNTLVSQSRVARTDKDKYDCVDYMCIFTDSSGSISDDDLKFFLSEIYAIACQLKPETLVLGQFDTRITDIQIFHSLPEFKRYSLHAEVKGRGGTECKCIWELLKTDPRFKKNSSELVIIMTDGYLTQYKRDPKTMNNLCWVILDNPNWTCDHNDTRTTTVHLNSKDIKKK